MQLAQGGPADISEEAEGARGGHSAGQHIMYSRIYDSHVQHSELESSEHLR